MLKNGFYFCNALLLFLMCGKYLFISLVVNGAKGKLMNDFGIFAEKLYY